MASLPPEVLTAHTDKIHAMLDDGDAHVRRCARFLLQEEEESNGEEEESDGISELGSAAETVSQLHNTRFSTSPYASS